MTDGYCDAIVEAFERRYDGKLGVTVEGEWAATDTAPRLMRTYGTDVFPDVDDYDPVAIAANARREERAKRLEGP